MIGKLLSDVENRVINFPENTQKKITELVLMTVFGNRENARRKLQEWSKNSTTKQELEMQIKKDLHYSSFNEFKRAFEDINSLPALFKKLQEIRNGSFKLDLSLEEIETIESFSCKMESGFKDITDPIDIPKDIATKMTFSIKETREQLKFKDNRTFKKWIDFFNLNIMQKADGSFKKRFSLLEYVEIWKSFVLNHFIGNDGTVQNLEELEIVFQESLVFSKGTLKNLTNGDHRKLQVYVDSVNSPEGVNIFPYTIAKEIIKNIEEDQDFLNGRLYKGSPGTSGRKSNRMI